MPWEMLPSILVGSALFFLALGVAYREWTAWNIGARSLPAEDEARQFAQRRFRRRMRVSALMLLASVLIPLGDSPLFYRIEFARWFAIHWLIVLGIVVVMIWMALGDLASSMAFNRQAQSELHRERDRLRDEIRQYHERRADHNGSPSP
jgi:hypothetical protein